MKKLAILFLLVIGAAGKQLSAQDTLPNFMVKNVGNNRIVVGWTNAYPVIKQLSIQRSFDSLAGYKTILTVPDPTTPQNGYVDAKATNDHMFYRLYILLDQGRYIFSNPKKPVLDTARRIIVPEIKVNFPNTDPVKNIDSVKKYDSIRKANPFYVKIDSLLGNDPGVMPTAVTPKNKPAGFTPSIYVYTYRDGYVRISLPDDEKPKKYSIKFFEEDNTFLFELKDIKEKEFKLDKTNFYHAGWFRFELYEDGKLLEKHKFYLEKDF